MFDFHEKRKIRGILYSKLTIGALFLLAGLLSFSVYDRYIVAKEMERKLDLKQVELDALRARASALEAKVRFLGEERGVEEELRSRFDVVREGEQAVILIDSSERASVENHVQGPMVPEAPKDIGWVKRLKFW